MNLKEINEILESEMSIIPQSGDYNLLQLALMRMCIKCNGVYDDLYCVEGYERVYSDHADAFLHHTYYTRVYYSQKKDAIINYCDSEDKEPSYYIEYHYDTKQDKLVADNLSDTLAGSCFLPYYKCCKNDDPYFKPIKIEGDLTIDCLLNIHRGKELVVSLPKLVGTLITPDGFSKQDVEKTYHLLTSLKVKSSDLPMLYQKYLERNKQKKNRI